jgi:GGDEF domain-containing protein
MSDEPHMRHAPRAAPVAGLPLESMLLRGEELARRWAISLVLARPLEGLADVPLEDLARDAPALCAQCVRALESDEELDRLTGASKDGREGSSPVSRLAVIAGAGDASALVEAVEALRGVLWGALLEELRWPMFEQTHAHRVADVSDRLAHVCASALAAALRVRAVEPDFAGRGAAVEPPGAEPGSDRQERGPAGASAAVIVDERDEPPAVPRRAPEEIEIRDERAEVGPAAWIGSIGRQLERFRQDGSSFAVLLVELPDIERLRRDLAPGELSELADQVERVLASELRHALRRGAPAGGGGAGEGPWSGSLTREGPGRYWLLAPHTDRTGASAMAERLTSAALTLARDRGAHLEIAIGTAVCPEDGREAAALAAHADLELYAARASGRTAVGRSSAPAEEPF